MSVGSDITTAQRARELEVKQNFWLYKYGKFLNVGLPHGASAGYFSQDG